MFTVDIFHFMLFSLNDAWSAVVNSTCLSHPRLETTERLGISKVLSVPKVQVHRWSNYLSPYTDLELFPKWRNSKHTQGFIRFRIHHSLIDFCHRILHIGPNVGFGRIEQPTLRRAAGDASFDLRGRMIRGMVQECEGWDGKVCFSVRYQPVVELVDMIYTNLM